MEEGQSKKCVYMVILRICIVEFVRLLFFQVRLNDWQNLGGKKQWANTATELHTPRIVLTMTGRIQGKLFVCQKSPFNM